jgi:hypothetical protein
MNNPSATIPLIQMLLSWTLLGVLLGWMLLFAFLALRPQETEKRETVELPTPSGAFPALLSQTLPDRPSLPIEISLSNAAMTVSEPAKDVGAASVR